MPEPLTLAHFDETMRAIADTLGDHGTILATIAATQNDHTKRLDRIERHLWNEHRMVEHERRITKLAERTGNPDLAIPFEKPIGAQ
jgi:hypothetical protein